MEELTAAEAKAEHEFLVRELERHNQLYYQEDQPEISDADYDRLRLRIEALEQQFPSLASPGEPNPEGRRPARREIRQGPPRGAHAVARQRLHR